MPEADAVIIERFRELPEDFRMLTRTQVAAALGISIFSLEAMHRAGDAPLRFKSSPKRWAYPARDFRLWLERRKAAAQKGT
jgi:hypothetical protein